MESAQLTLHRNLTSRAHKSIQSGIELEEKKGDRDLALQFYRNGIKDIEDALSIQFQSYGEQSAVTKTRNSMKKTLMQIQERILELERIPSEEGMIGKVKSLFLSSSSDNNKVIKAESPKVQQKKTYSKELSALANQILDEILIEKPNVTWDDIIGLESAKKALHEAVILPYLRPEIFTGLRSPPRGILLFGPPGQLNIYLGTGKTMLAKAVATESKAKFFSISASSLTSKNYGDGEKLVRALFAMAKELQPSIIFIDEIDSILSERSEGEHEASRRLKTEFLLQFDGIGGCNDERILLLAATNRPFELDQAALRRLVKRIYIPLPEYATRISLLKYLLASTHNNIGPTQLDLLSRKTAGYSSSDLTAVAREAALGPVRELGDRLLTASDRNIRPIELNDFVSALKAIRPSVSSNYISDIEQWNNERGIVGN